MNKNFFENIDSEKKAYWLGFVWADGHVSTKAPWFVVVQIKDKNHLEKMCADLEYTGEIKDRPGGSYKPESIQARVAFCRKKLCDDLNNLGRNNKVKSIPDIRKDLIPHFIRGYFDGDGSIYNSKSSSKGKKYSYLSASIIGENELMNDVKNHFNSAGINSNYKECNSDGMIYLEIYGGNNMRALYEYMYKDSTIYMDRKHIKWQQLYCPYGERSL